MKKSVCVDLDGVLAYYGDEGWLGIDHYGPVVPEAKEFLERLRKKYDVIIHTCRCNPEIDKPTSANLLRNRVREWLEENDLPYDDIYIGIGKPIASAYIDDKAICVDQSSPESYELACEILGV